MRMLGLIGLTGVLLFVWQGSARAGDAVVLKACSYQLTREGYPLPKRLLRIGAIVKVLATHGTKAEVATSTGDQVSVRLANLRLLPAPPPPAPLAFPLAAIPTPAPPVSLPSPSPSPAPTGGSTPAKTSEPSHPQETSKRSASVRCSHVLKNGQQCSRMTTSPNGLCWQHGGD